MSFDLDRKDTICAPATSSAGAISVVRVSGPRSNEICARVFRPNKTQRDFVATLGHIVNGDDVVDEALCTRFPAGKSYTGEASFELSIHGGAVTMRAVLRVLVDAGCRVAEPGELTLRAMLNGRIDLAQAEAVDDVIRAKTLTAQKAALRNLAGGVSNAIDPVRNAIVDALAEIEARLDFPDEDIGAAKLDEIARSLDDARAIAAKHIAQSRAGRLLHDGARVVLYGPPNAGKSTLLNALVGSERALVHDEPGTTRDVLEATVDIGGIPVTLVDVAGVRPLDEAGAVEKLGIARAHAERERADLVVAIVPIDSSDDVFALRGDLAVLSKSDLSSRGSDPSAGGRGGDGGEGGDDGDHGDRGDGRDGGGRGRAGVDGGALVLSAKSGFGLDALRAAIASHLGAHDAGEALLSRARQVDEVRAAHDALGVAVDALRAHAVGEVVASELRRAARSLDRLLGRDVDVDVLDLVFSRFCIGK